jgi:hypothetical protein
VNEVKVILGCGEDGSNNRQDINEAWRMKTQKFTKYKELVVVCMKRFLKRIRRVLLETINIKRL